jgi:hypothetical protein
VLLFMVLWFTFSYLPMAHMVWYWAGPDAYTSAEAADKATQRPASCSRRARSTSPAAPWCTSTPPSPAWSAPYLVGKRVGYGKEGDGPAQPDHDHDRRLAAVVRLVRLQRRLGAGSQRHGGAGLRQHLAGNRDARHAVSGW